MQIIRIIPGCFEDTLEKKWAYPLKNKRDGECAVLLESYSFEGIPCSKVVFNYPDGRTEEEIVPNKWLEKLNKKP